jgi:hypothetical protein
MKKTRYGSFTSMAAAAAFALTACTPAPEDAAATNGGETSDPSAEERIPTTVPTGTELTFVIDETLSTGDANAGQMFDAHLAGPVASSDGSIALPAGTAARGIVVESHKSGGSDDPAALILRLETVEFEGQMVPIVGTVTGAEIDTSTRDTGAETAAKIAIGAAAGAIIGQIIGKNTESTLAGAGVGAVAGTVVALTTRDGHATMPSGSTIVVRLDQPLRASN